MILRKAYGGAFITMNCKDLGAPAAFAWPEAEIGIMSPRAAVEIIHRRELVAEGAAEQDAVRLAERYARTQLSAGAALERGVIDAVIAPHETRARLVDALFGHAHLIGVGGRSRTTHEEEVEDMEGCTIWFTGLSGAGKSTVAALVEAELRARGDRVEVLDGDVVRRNLSKGLGFSREDRDTNIRRIAFVADVLSRNGVCVLAAAISPYRDTRDEARALMGPRFLEVHVKASVARVPTARHQGPVRQGAARRAPAVHRGLGPLRGALGPRPGARHRARDRRGVGREGPGSDRGPRARRRSRRVMPRLRLDPRRTADLELLANGGFWPLDGFQGEADWAAVLDTMRLADGRPWPIPITLGSDVGEVGDTLVLVGHEGTTLGTMAVEEVFERDLRARGPRASFARPTARTPVWPRCSPSRRGRSPVRSPCAPCRATRAPSTATSSPRSPRAAPSPSDGWKTVVGFQTRNPIHRAHEYIMKVALEIDGRPVHASAGRRDQGRRRSAQTCACAATGPGRTLLPARPRRCSRSTRPRCATPGPREAVFHALVRKNYGCTHFIVGRDHAGVGNYYGTYDAQHIFEEFAAERARHHAAHSSSTPSTARSSAGMATRRPARDAEDRVTLSRHQGARDAAGGRTPARGVHAPRGRRHPHRGPARPRRAALAAADGAAP